MLYPSAGAVLPYVAAVAQYCSHSWARVLVTQTGWLPACPGARLRCPGGVYQHTRSSGRRWKEKVISSFLMTPRRGGRWRLWCLNNSKETVRLWGFLQYMLSVCTNKCLTWIWQLIYGFGLRLISIFQIEPSSRISKVSPPPCAEGHCGL